MSQTVVLITVLIASLTVIGVLIWFGLPDKVHMLSIAEYLLEHDEMEAKALYGRSSLLPVMINMCVRELHASGRIARREQEPMNPEARTLVYYALTESGRRWARRLMKDNAPRVKPSV